MDTLTRQLPTQSHRVLARLQVETTAKALGAKSWRDVLTIRWRHLGPGGPPPPGRGRTVGSAALADRRTVGTGVARDGRRCRPRPDHRRARRIIRKAIGKIPGFVDAATRTQIEVDWARLAVKVGPKELLDGVELRLFLLDQDGPEPDDTERARKRGFSIGKQGRDGTSAGHRMLDPGGAGDLGADPRQVRRARDVQSG